MFQLDPNDSKELAFAIHKVVRQSGLTLAVIAERLKQEYDVKATPAVSAIPFTEGQFGCNALCRY